MGHCHKRETDVSDFSECEVTNISLQFKTFFPIFFMHFIFLRLVRGRAEAQNYANSSQKQAKKLCF